MDNELNELEEFIDDAGRLFAADVESIIAEFREALKPLVTDKEAALEESERIRREADEIFNTAKAEAVEKCATSIRKAAQLRAKKSEHPEHIEQACDSYLRPIECNGAIIEPSAILKMVGRSEKARRESEAYYKRMKRRRDMARGIIPMSHHGIC